MEQDHKKLVQERILTNEGFVRAVFSGQQKGSSLQWLKVVVRPVEIKGARNLQFSYFDAKKDITSNYLPGESTHWMNCWRFHSGIFL